jgi:hypothetical protein
MAADPAKKPKRKAPWTGRRKVLDPKSRLSTIRWTAQQYTAVNDSAGAAGLSVGAFLRTIALGDAGPRSVRRHPVEKRELARLLGLLGNLTSNCNQIAKAIHQTGNLPSWSELAAIREEVAVMRAALIAALGREP